MARMAATGVRRGVAGLLGTTARSRVSRSLVGASLVGALAVAATLPWLLFTTSEHSQLVAWQDANAAAKPVNGEEEVVVVSGSVELMEHVKPYDWLQANDPVYMKPRTKKRRGRQPPAAAPAQDFLSLLFGAPPKPRRAFVAPAARPVSRPSRPPAVVRVTRRPQAAEPVVRVSYVPAPVQRYRALCVRTCDGYYWPISFASTRKELPDDAAVCKSSCGSPTKLYFYDTPSKDPASEGVEQMTDLMGGKYADTATAFLYRTAANPSCRCTPQPWEQASLDRHAQYAELAKSGKKILVDKRPGKAAPIEVRRVTSVIYRTTRSETALSTVAPAPRSIIRQAPRPARQAAPPRRKVRRTAAALPKNFGAALGFRTPAASPVARRRAPAPSRPSGYTGFNEQPKWLR